MTVENQFPHQRYTANGTNASFALGFYVEDKDHFEVKKNDQSISKTTYTYDKNSNSIVLNPTPKQGDTIEITRATVPDRAVTYATYNNSFRPEVLNKDIDKIWLRIQELGVADQLLKIYTERLHIEQKDYIDNEDQLIKNMISDLRNYVNQQDNNLNQRIDSLKTYTDNQDTNLSNRFETLINQQGVSLKQLENYYQYLLKEMASIASSKGWMASLVSSVNGKNQQQVNDNTAYFYNTVSEMVADESLQNGVIVATKGYHNVFDGGRSNLFNISSRYRLLNFFS